MTMANTGSFEEIRGPSSDVGFEEIRGSSDVGFEIEPPEVTKSKWTGSVTYNCPWDKFRRPGVQALLQWKFNTTNESSIPSEKMVLDRYMPVQPINWNVLCNPPADKIQVIWIGHATVLVQFDGITILSDPLFRDFCGPETAAYLKSMGYQRYRKAALQGKDIPKLDAVIISNSRYDHLDTGSVKEIYAHHKGVRWFVASGMKDWLIGQGIVENIVEMTWTGERTIELEGKHFKFICLPAQHWSQRGAFDLNKVLWCSWAVKGPDPNNFSYYFGGDTGYYGPLFKQIGREHGPFSLAALPIGGYHPRSITEYQHVDPNEAVQIHTDIQSQQSIGILWGTFELTNEFFLEPPNKVKQIMEEKGQDPGKFPSLMLGETWVVGTPREEAPFMGILGPKDMEMERMAERS